MAKILLGFMGTGKTTVGRILDPKFHDMDELIVEEIGMSINDYFAVEGEAAFRRREAEMLEPIACILSCSASTPPKRYAPKAARAGFQSPNITRATAIHPLPAVMPSIHICA